MTRYINIRYDCDFTNCRYNLAGDCESQQLHGSCKYAKLYGKMSTAEETAPVVSDKTDEFEKAIASIRGEHDKLEAENKALTAFKTFFEELYGKGLEVAGYHLNGALEPFDSFYEFAVDSMENTRKQNPLTTSMKTQLKK